MDYQRVPSKNKDVVSKIRFSEKRRRVMDGALVIVRLYVRAPSYYS